MGWGPRAGQVAGGVLPLLAFSHNSGSGADEGQGQQTSKQKPAFRRVQGRKGERRREFLIDVYTVCRRFALHMVLIGYRTVKAEHDHEGDSVPLFEFRSFLQGLSVILSSARCRSSFNYALLRRSIPTIADSS
ncbi:hypothetical protein EMCG_07173 [[Emmonsia] crescens]|uniref:Uncharacterized protein n=1 Tax=[Emmonsia] crescens TaxID=73230 RepID=A0A0G2JBA7_9EURO|nr:hypothetical protein EMCG_07173 [Emmonsia crescens UAMH 3008]